MAAGGTLSLKAVDFSSGHPWRPLGLSGVHFSVSILSINNVFKETKRKPKRLYLGDQLNEVRERDVHDNVTRKVEDDNDADDNMFPEDNYADYNMFIEDEGEGSTLTDKFPSGS